MAGKEELEIFISEEGEIKIYVKGIKGPACRDIVRNFSSGIGRITEFVKTSEFYQKPETGNIVKHKGRNA
ncbi:MAG: DUF2997 domain-containing protein [Candidatus Omnitrophica bacterium]|nr:DUF2997 domain-containing protein [Candidatus Omnitrophota bacterium]